MIKEYKHLIRLQRFPYGTFSLFKNIRDGDISLEMAEKDQKKFRREYGQIKLGNPDHKSGKQLYTIKNIKNLYDSSQNTIYKSIRKKFKKDSRSTALIK